MHVTPIVCLRDNYAYLLWRERGGEALVVDPGQAGKVLDMVEYLGLSLRAVLCTHHHADHTGGLPELAHRLKGLAVFGHRVDQGRVPELTRGVEDGEKIGRAHV